MNFEQWMQSRLTAHGFPVGPIDGIVGPKTRAALAAFQRSRKLKVTQVGDAPTVEALRVSATLHTPRDPERDLTPIPSPAASPWPRQADVPAFYGAVGKNQVFLSLPYPMRLSWDLGVTTQRVSVHTKVAESMGRVMEKVARRFNPAQRSDLGIDILGGTLNVRRMVGGTQYSMHSWGIAIDFDPLRNDINWTSKGTHRQTGKACPIPRLSMPDAIPFWELWEEEGWVSLGRARDFDWMHSQAARL